ncbi:MAG: DUF1573 domain-containing protein [Ignavibacteriales bacterium]|nr:DUF1573 domain-containing protein [Ignavibacteriales bacterium]
MKPYSHIRSFPASLILLIGVVTAQPKIQLNSTKIDLGTIYHGDVKKVNLVVSNAGDKPLTISRIETSCGCTSAKKSVPTLAPGESDTIEISYNSTGFEGKITKAVTIQSNDPAKMYVDATITGIVTTELAVVPKMSLLNFGSSKVGVPSTASFVFRNTSPETITLRGVTSADTSVRAQIGFRTINPSDTITISFTFTPRSNSLSDTYFYLETTSPRQPKVPFRFMYVGK